MKCDIDVNAVGCNGWQWLETECRERGKWRRNSCCSAAEDADNRILQRISLVFHHLVWQILCICLHVACIKQTSFGLAQALFSYI